MGNSLEHLTSLEKYIDHRIASRKNPLFEGAHHSAKEILTSKLKAIGSRGCAEQ